MMMSMNKVVFDTAPSSAPVVAAVATASVPKALSSVTLATTMTTREKLDGTVCPRRVSSSDRHDAPKTHNQLKESLRLLPTQAKVQKDHVHDVHQARQQQQQQQQQQQREPQQDHHHHQQEEEPQQQQLNQQQNDVDLDDEKLFPSTYDEFKRCFQSETWLFYYLQGYDANMIGMFKNKLGFDFRSYQYVHKEIFDDDDMNDKSLSRRDGSSRKRKTKRFQTMSEVREYFMIHGIPYRRRIMRQQSNHHHHQQQQHPQEGTEAATVIDPYYVKFELWMRRDICSKGLFSDARSCVTLDGYRYEIRPISSIQELIAVLQHSYCGPVSYRVYYNNSIADDEEDDDRTDTDSDSDCSEKKCSMRSQTRKSFHLIGMDACVTTSTGSETGGTNIGTRSSRRRTAATGGIGGSISAYHHPHQRRILKEDMAVVYIDITLMELRVLLRQKLDVYIQRKEIFDRNQRLAFEMWVATCPVLIHDHPTLQDPEPNSNGEEDCGDDVSTTELDGGFVQLEYDGSLDKSDEPWLKDEDEHLKRLHERYTTGASEKNKSSKLLSTSSTARKTTDWKTISLLLPGRSVEACKKQYKEIQRKLNPKLERQPPPSWTVTMTEDEREASVKAETKARTAKHIKTQLKAMKMKSRKMTEDEILASVKAEGKARILGQIKKAMKMKSSMKGDREYSKRPASLISTSTNNAKDRDNRSDTSTSLTLREDHPIFREQIDKPLKKKKRTECTSKLPQQKERRVSASMSASGDENERHSRRTQNMANSSRSKSDKKRNKNSPIPRNVSITDSSEDGNLEDALSVSLPMLDEDEQEIYEIQKRRKKKQKKTSPSYVDHSTQGAVAFEGASSPNNHMNETGSHSSSRDTSAPPQDNMNRTLSESSSAERQRSWKSDTMVMKDDTASSPAASATPDSPHFIKDPETHEELENCLQNQYWLYDQMKLFHKIVAEDRNKFFHQMVGLLEKNNVSVSISSTESPVDGVAMGCDEDCRKSNNSEQELVKQLLREGIPNVNNWKEIFDRYRIDNWIRLVGFTDGTLLHDGAPAFRYVPLSDTDIIRILLDHFRGEICFVDHDNRSYCIAPTSTHFSPPHFSLEELRVRLFRQCYRKGTKDILTDSITDPAERLKIQMWIASAPLDAHVPPVYVHKLVANNGTTAAEFDKASTEGAGQEATPPNSRMISLMQWVWGLAKM